jgi:HD superfamily phosphohydrolase
VIRIAALVHDVTHVPFGHSIEDQDGIFGRHDSPRASSACSAATGSGRRSAALGVATDVLAILATPTRATARPPYWTQIVGGTFACDILDYLARDAYFTGCKLAVDPRVTSYFKIDRASGTSTSTSPSTSSCARTSSPRSCACSRRATTSPSASTTTTPRSRRAR